MPRNLPTRGRPTLRDMHELTPAARLSAWGSAALEGTVSLDDAADVIAGSGGTAHRFFGLVGEEGGVNIAYALGRLRADGAHGLRLVLPRPGDIAGLPGPATFNDQALSRGEAVLTVGGPPRGVLGGLSGGARGAWTVQDVSPDDRTPLSLRDAEWSLNRQMREATAVLMQLDIARWEPVAAEVLQHQASNATPASLPPSSPARAHHILECALRMLTIVEVARQSDGGAVTSVEADARRQVLRDLDTAARRGLEAACSAAVR
jgi:hypothetical protein